MDRFLVPAAADTVNAFRLVPASSEAGTDVDKATRIDRGRPLSYGRRYHHGGAMRTFVLFGIDKYGSAHLLSIVRLENGTLELAAHMLGGTVADIGTADRPEYKPYFELGAACATFAPGICTPEALTVACRQAGFNAEDLIANYRYRFHYVYRSAVLGEAPCICRNDS